MVDPDYNPEDEGAERVEVESKTDKVPSPKNIKKRKPSKLKEEQVKKKQKVSPKKEKTSQKKDIDKEKKSKKEKAGPSKEDKDTEKPKEDKDTGKPSPKKSAKKMKKPVKNPRSAKRKFFQQTACLREIRKAQKALDLAIPRLPFQRLIRQIAEEYKIGLLWQLNALACLQEAAEDFMIEILGDSFILAAHAKRVTLMDKDIIILRRIRYRFSKILEPVPLKDMKTFKILSIPPVRKDRKEKIKIEEVTEEAQENIMMEEKLVSLEDEEEKLKIDLFQINQKGFTVRLFSETDLLSREDYNDIDEASLKILQKKDEEINDAIIMISLRYVSNLKCIFL